ncbi:MAG: YceD family protein, partial [Bacillota bacterium]
RMECSRCLSGFEQPLELEFSEEFYQGAPSEERDGFSFEGDWIDLTEMAETNIVLNLPAKKLCRQDCAGLCPACGKELSLGSCDCAIQQADDDFHRDLLKLKALLQDDKEV